EAEAAGRGLVDLLDRITDGFIGLDREWRITHLNQAAVAILLPLGGPPQAGPRGGLWSVLPAPAGARRRPPPEAAAGAQTPVAFEELEAPLETWLAVHAYPSPGGVSVYVQDVTDRKRVEAERAELLARERTARAEAELANRAKDEFLATLSHELR